MKLERHTVCPPGTKNMSTFPKKDSGETWWFWCPGCESHHMFTTKHYKGESKGRPLWKFDGNVARPTFSPSLLLRGWKDPQTGELKGQCHLHVRAGKIAYCGDCSHKLKGQTIPMEVLP